MSTVRLSPVGDSVDLLALVQSQQKPTLQHLMAMQMTTKEKFLCSDCFTARGVFCDAIIVELVFKKKKKPKQA